MMTKRQAETLAFVVAYQAGNGGASPSLDEIASALSIKARSRAHYLLRGLEDRGIIKRGYGKVRAIEVLASAPS